MRGVSSESVKLEEMRRLVRMRPVELDGTARRLAACHTVSDLRRVAARRIPRPVFDYVDGAADEELTVAANVAAFRAWQFQPRVLCDVSAADTSSAILGRQVPVPMALAPTGYTRMLHQDGERGAARSAVRHGLPYTLSTMATTGIEDLASAVAGMTDHARVPGDAGDRPPGTRHARYGAPSTGHAPGGTGGRPPGWQLDPPSDLWFQLYVLKDRDKAHALVDRAWANGYRVLVVTVDTVVAGNRIRDKRNGLSMPPELSLHTIAQVATRPGYWWRLLSGPVLEYANFAGQPTATLMQTAEFFDPAINWDHIAALRSRWKGKLIIKGPLGAADALRAVEAGADGIQLSNHGGRQLDRCVAPVDLIAPVREAVGPAVTLLVDSGIRHGADLVVALALGADAGVLGRAFVYGLMAGGERGVDRALDIITAQFRATMQLLGVASVEELRKSGRDLLIRA
jgi:L-lactate dehydrogenase (cytochrome)